MARYGQTTTLRPRAILRQARAFFGPVEGGLGLSIARESWNEIVFVGGGGGVEVTALPRAGNLGTTDVTILSREYDPWAERFLEVLSTAARPPSPWRRAWRSIVRFVAR